MSDAERLAATAVEADADADAMTDLTACCAMMLFLIVLLSAARLAGVPRWSVWLLGVAVAGRE